eukprot:3491164-Rhodomonas_salina.1
MDLILPRLTRTCQVRGRAGSEPERRGRSAGIECYVAKSNAICCFPGTVCRANVFDFAGVVLTIVRWLYQLNCVFGNEGGDFRLLVAFLYRPTRALRTVRSWFGYGATLSGPMVLRASDALSSIAG